MYNEVGSPSSGMSLQLEQVETGMTQDEQYTADCIDKWIRTGFYAHDDIEQIADDIIEEGVNAEKLKSLIAPRLRTKLREERSWPAVTDRGQLDKVFYDPHEQSICALANAGYTICDVYSDVSEAVAAAPEGHYKG